MSRWFGAEFLKLTIRKRLLLTCTALVLLSAVIAAVSLYTAASADSQLRKIAFDAMPGARWALTIDLAINEYRGNYWKHISSRDAATMAKIEQANEELRDKLSQALKNYAATINEQEDRAQFGRANSALDRYFAALAPVLPLSREGKNDEATVAYNQSADPAFQEVKEVLADLVDWNVKRADAAATSGSQTADFGRNLTVFLALVAIVAGSLLGYRLVRSLSTQLHNLTSDLTESAREVAAAAAQISSSSQSLSQNASEQAAAIEETSASTQEVTAHVQKNADIATELTSTMSQAVPIVERVNGSLSGLVESMSHLQNSSNRIASIVKVIDEIAFQTNILALNAAVEAARSGDAGMGFAVVADEVRNLAHRSAQAARETGSLIEESVKTVHESSAKLQDLIEASRVNGTHAARVKDLVDLVASATHQQSQSIREIAHTLPQLEQATHHIAGSAEEGASAAEEMTAQSEKLKEVTQIMATTMGF